MCGKEQQLVAAGFLLFPSKTQKQTLPSHFYASVLARLCITVLFWQFCYCDFWRWVETETQMRMLNSEVALLPNSTHKYNSTKPQQTDLSFKTGPYLSFLSFSSIKKYDSLYYILIIRSILPNDRKALQNICSSSLSLYIRKRLLLLVSWRGPAGDHKITKI